MSVPGPAGGAQKETRSKIFVGVVVSLAVTALTTAGKWLYGSLRLDATWVFVFVASLLIPGTILAISGFRTGSLLLNRSFRWFVPIYAFIVGILAVTGVLQGSRTPMVGLAKAERSNWFRLGWLGDWRYRLAGKKEPQLKLIIVTQPPKSLEDSRGNLARIIDAAKDNGARALAVDLTLDRVSNMDVLVQRRIIAAGPMPVFLGYGFDTADADLFRRPPAPILDAAAPVAQRQGHLVVFGDRDRKVRTLPVGLGGDTLLPSLSVRVARALDSGARLPASGLLEPVPSRVRFPEFPIDSLDQNLARLGQRVVLFGEASPRETFDTPWGPMLGVQLHAQAIHALLEDTWFVRPPWWPAMLVLVGGIYMLAVAATAGKSRPVIAGLCLAITAVYAVAAGILAWQRIWLDVVHVAAGLWVFALLLLLFPRRTVAGAQERDVTGSGVREPPPSFVRVT